MGSSTADRGFSCDFLKEIDKGPLGSVWLGRIARGQETGRLVTVRRVAIADLSAVERDAIKAAAHLSTTLVHPSLVKALRAYEQEGELLVVGEHIDGAPLAVLRRLAVDTEQPLPPDVAVRIVLDILRASVGARAQLAVGRQRRLVYAEGALVACFGETLLGDVGVLSELAAAARARLDAELATQLAPEELLGGPSDERAEVFAAGVLLWELLANRRLFSGATFGDVRRTLIRCEVPELGSLQIPGLRLPEEISHIVARATAREPQERFLTVHALLKALSAFAIDRSEGERRVRLSLEQLAGPFLAACRRSADLPVPRQTDEAGVPWVTPTLPPAEGSNGTEFPPDESPTLPARRLVHTERVCIPVSLPVLMSPTPPRLLPPPARPLAVRPSVLESSAASVVTDLVHRKRSRWAVGAVVALGLALVSGLFLLFRPAASLSPVPEQVSASAMPFGAAGVATAARLPASVRQPVGRERDPVAVDAPLEPGALQQTQRTDARGAHPDDTTLDAGMTDVGTSSSSTEAGAPKGSSPSRRSFRPRSIEPYRPRGI